MCVRACAWVGYKFPSKVKSCLFCAHWPQIIKRLMQWSAKKSDADFSTKRVQIPLKLDITYKTWLGSSAAYELQWNQTVQHDWSRLILCSGPCAQHTSCKPVFSHFNHHWREVLDAAQPTASRGPRRLSQIKLTGNLSACDTDMWQPQALKAL